MSHLIKLSNTAPMEKHIIQSMKDFENRYNNIYACDFTKMIYLKLLKIL